ncbi:MAG: gliding motility-associated C-terminal domain-containing protein [Bacteroidota bacterium]
MTSKRSIAFVCFCCLLFPVVFGQDQDQLSDTVGLSANQLQMIESLASDSVDSELDVPNVFTPNGDKVNDYFEVTTDGVKVYDFTVFTRTGNRIYHSLSPRIFWDGKSIGGKDLPEGIYYYVIEEEGGSEPFKSAGFMHLFR